MKPLHKSEALDFYQSCLPWSAVWCEDAPRGFTFHILGLLGKGLAAGQKD